MKKDLFLTLGATLLAVIMVAFAAGISTPPTTAQEPSPQPTATQATPTPTITVTPYATMGCCYARPLSGETYYSDNRDFEGSGGAPMTAEACERYAKWVFEKRGFNVTHFAVGLKCPSTAAGACAEPGKTQAPAELLTYTATGETQAKAQGECVSKLEPSLKCPGSCERYVSALPIVISAKQTKTKAVDGKDEWEVKCQAAASCRLPGKTGQ